MKKCGFTRKPCMEHDCVQYILIQGKNPQTGADVNEWGCAIAWMPILQIESSQQMRQAGAAVESFRNEMVTGNQEFLGMLKVARIEHENSGK